MREWQSSAAAKMDKILMQQQYYCFPNQQIRIINTDRKVTPFLYHIQTKSLNRMWDDETQSAVYTER